MTHPLVLQLRFTRAEFARGLKGVTAEEALRHFGPMNCISWMVGQDVYKRQVVTMVAAIRIARPDRRRGRVEDSMAGSILC